MDVKTWTYLIVGITFALYIGIAIWSRAKSTSESVSYTHLTLPTIYSV